MASKNKKKCLRSNSSGDEVDSNLGVKPLPQLPSEKLPTKAEVIGHALHIMSTTSNLGYESVVFPLSKILRDHWIARNVYPINITRVRTRVKKVMNDFKWLKRVPVCKRDGKKWKEEFEKLVSDRDCLFDIFCEDKQERELMEIEYGIIMEKDDFEFLNAMRTNRKLASCKGVDSSWYKKKSIEEEKLSKKKVRENATFLVSTIDDDENVDDDDDDDEVEELDDMIIDADEPDYDDQIDELPTTSKRRKLFNDISKTDSPSPIKTRSQSTLETPNTSKKTAENLNKFVRHSSNKVRDDIYEACAEMSGYGFSYYECQIALKVVSRLFGCEWKIPRESRGQTINPDVDDNSSNDDETFDNNTLPTRKAIRNMLARIEVQSLKLAADKIVNLSESDVITHATDSTTRKKVGCFAPQGLHVNQETYIPLPTLQLGSETTKNISDSIATGFEMMAVASDYSASDLYSTVDLHMTDATAHNKGVAKEVANVMNRENAAGQLFCNPHTTLGYDRCIKKVIATIEQKMNVASLLNSFVLDININQESDTVSLTIISWMLNLFGPDMVQKPWNYYNDFVVYLKKEGRNIHLFQMKDSRFGLLSQSCAVCLYHWNDFESFLDSHSYITNKLACLIRDGMQQSYVKVVSCVCAAFGVHLILPFHYKTKSTKSTHTSLKEFFTTLHNNLTSVPVNESFFDFISPAFSAFSDDVFNGSKKEFGNDVLQTVTMYAKKHLDECVVLANIILPKLAETLSMQRGKFYGFGTHESEFPVFEQSVNVDKAITHNLQLERECGDHDNRLNKKCNITTVSRDNILKKCTTLRLECNDGFRKYASKVEEMKRVRAEWDERQMRLREAGLSAKEAEQLNKENRKMKILEDLKKVGGPFTCEEQVDEFMKSDIDDEAKQMRMKNEIIYARDSTRSIPAAGVLFRIMKTDPTTKKRKTMSATEFANNLKTVLGKKNNKSEVTLEDFMLAMWHSDI